MVWILDQLDKDHCKESIITFNSYDKKKDE
nr:MAG TPA: hypothetical protein [Caudoviricetes sp.]